ncbi:hypothetical protein PYW07_015049 [Mythimna separata]|uniref:Rap1 GTPase-GDP dissociation stimulator 1-B n=1 Tax=Mythimna separata TaxID=271217 RepID=A0AAD8DY52_MYTSE|nr:hypothetical protein PYW07_015049 [Mythimna separata]
MDGSSPKKSTSLETLVIQNITNVTDLKAKLSEIIKTGKDYEYDVSTCLKTLITSNDQDIAQLSVEAIAELVKSDEKRETYADREIIGPILDILRRETTSDNVELVRHCCRALGNLCCDCDTSRRIIIELEGIAVLVKLLERSIDMQFEEIQMLASKSLLNFAIGGTDFTEAIFQGGVVDMVQRMLCIELQKKLFDSDTITTSLLLLSVINDNTPELLYNEMLNKTILQILKETSTVEISEMCLDHLHSQAEHETVKTLIAKEGGVQLVCSRLERFVKEHNAGELNVNDSEVDAIMKQACELVIIVLTGDEAMHILYNNGVGEVYQTSVKWLDSQNYQLLTTAVLAIGNFARQDDYCTQMMQDNIFDKLLDIFEVYNSFSIQMQKEPEKTHPIDPVTVIKLLHGVLSTLRNLAVAAQNKRVAAARGRAAPLLINALHTTQDHHVAYKLLATIRLLVDGQGQCSSCRAAPLLINALHTTQDHHVAYKLLATIRLLVDGQGQCSSCRAAPLLINALHTTQDHHVAYKLLATIRLLVDGQEGSAKILASNGLALEAIAKWGHAAEYAGAAGEAPRLLAWTVKQLRHHYQWRHIVEIEGCISSLVNMLVASHSLMQNEAILALTLLAIESIKTRVPEYEKPYDYEKSFNLQLIKAEIGKHVTILIDTNCAKMPIEVAENLLAFLDITSKNNLVATDYKVAKVHESLMKFSDSRNDLTSDMKACIYGVFSSITNNAKT